MAMAKASSDVKNQTRTGKERSDIMDWIKDIKPVGGKIDSKSNLRIVTKPITPIMGRRPSPRMKVAKRISPKSQKEEQTIDKFKKSLGLGEHLSLITTDIEVKEEFFEDRKSVDSSKEDILCGNCGKTFRVISDLRKHNEICTIFSELTPSQNQRLAQPNSRSVNQMDWSVNSRSNDQPINSQNGSWFSKPVEKKKTSKLFKAVPPKPIPTYPMFPIIPAHYLSHSIFPPNFFNPTLSNFPANQGQPLIPNFPYHPLSTVNPNQVQATHPINSIHGTFSSFPGPPALKTENPATPATRTQTPETPPPRAPTQGNLSPGTPVSGKRSQKGTFKCEECDQSFSFENSKKRHMRIHSGEKPHECQKCRERFTFGPQLKRHIKICDKEFVNMKDGVFCYQCGQDFSNVKETKKHVCMSFPFNPVTTSRSNQPSQATALFDLASGTPKSRTLFPAALALRSPVTPTPVIQNYAKAASGAVTPTLGITAHGKPTIETTVHRGPGRPKGSKSKFGKLKGNKRTPLTPKSSATPTIIPNNKVQTAGEPTKQISTTVTPTSRTVTQDPNLGVPTSKYQTLGTSAHKGPGRPKGSKSGKLKSGQKGAFKCVECDQMFSFENSRKRHMRIHSGEKPYDCKKCGAKFTFAAQLDRHSKKCSGVFVKKEIIFKCSECGRGFDKMGKLKMHTCLSSHKEKMDELKSIKNTSGNPMEILGL